jgi:hypothetical protein
LVLARIRNRREAADPRKSLIMLAIQCKMNRREACDAVDLA